MNVLDNPFYRLDLPLCASRREISQRCDTLVLTLESEELDRAREQLTHPVKRIDAELAWLPELSPAAAQSWLDRCKRDPKTTLQTLSRLPPLSRCNLLAALLARWRKPESDELAAAIRLLLRSCSEMDEESVKRVLNEERAVAGLPVIPAANSLTIPLQQRRLYYSGSVREALAHCERAPEILSTLLLEQQAKPLFIEALRNMPDATSNSEETIRVILQIVVDQFGEPTANDMKHYLVRFISDVHTGKVNLESLPKENTEESLHEIIDGYLLDQETNLQALLAQCVQTNNAFSEIHGLADRLIAEQHAQGSPQVRMLQTDLERRIYPLYQSLSHWRPILRLWQHLLNRRGLLKTPETLHRLIEQVRDLAKSLAKNPFSVGECLHVANWLDEIFEGFKDIHSAWFDIGYQLGSNYPELATEAYQRAISINPDFPAAWNNLGVAYERQNRLTDAKDAFQQAIEFRDDVVLYWRNLQKISVKMQDTTQTTMAQHRLLELEGGSADDWFSLGVDYADKLHDKERAHQAFNQALRLQPGHAGATKRFKIEITKNQ